MGPLKDASETPQEEPLKRGRGKNPASRANLKPGLNEHIEQGEGGKLKAKGKKVRKLSSQKHDDLVAIDHVLSQPPEADRTYQQSNFRKLQQDDLASLYRLKIQLEARKPEPPAENTVHQADAKLPPLIRDGETPCPLCGQAAYPEDQTEARLLAETQLAGIPDKLAEHAVLKARVAELEADVARLSKEEVPSGSA